MSFIITRHLSSGFSLTDGQCRKKQHPGWKRWRKNEPWVVRQQQHSKKWLPKDSGRKHHSLSPNPNVFPQWSLTDCETGLGKNDRARRKIPPPRVGQMLLEIYRFPKRAALCLLRRPIPNRYAVRWIWWVWERRAIMPRSTPSRARKAGKTIPREPSRRSNNGPLEQLWKILLRLWIAGNRQRKGVCHDGSPI